MAERPISPDYTVNTNMTRNFCSGNVMWDGKEVRFSDLEHHILPNCANLKSVSLQGGTNGEAWLSVQYKIPLKYHMPFNHQGFTFSSTPIFGCPGNKRRRL